VFGLLGIPWFMVYASAKVFYIPMGFFVCGVILCPDVCPISKVLTTLGGVVASAAIIPFAEKANHLR
jgi:hypothetical protein